MKSKTYQRRNKTKPNVKKVENSTLSNLESDLDLLQRELATPNISHKMSLLESDMASLSRTRREDASVISKKMSSPITIRKRGGTSEFNFFKKKTEKIINFDPTFTPKKKREKNEKEEDSLSKLQRVVGRDKILIEDS